MIKTEDITFEPVKGGIHAGGQHAQKNATGVRATHAPTGTTVVVRTRSLAASKRRAVEEIRRRVEQLRRSKRQRIRKARRDDAIKKEGRYIRTYNFKSRRVTDHRTGASADLREVLNGNLSALQTAELMRRLEGGCVDADQAD